MSLPRIAVVFNKWWELDPALSAMISGSVRQHNALPWPQLFSHPRARHNPNEPASPDRVRPRAVFATSFAIIDVWCVSDFLEHFPDKPKWQSSTERKAERLAEMFGLGDIDYCVAAGTAASGDYPSRNGSVVIGTRCFLHNAKPDGTNSDSNWQGGPFDTVLESKFTREEFALLSAVESRLKPEATLRMLPPPLNAAPELGIIADYDAVAVSSCNVTDYREYDLTDKATLEAFSKAAPLSILGSLETTHGLIRALGPDRFVFVSGIVDRLLHFNDDVGPRTYAQNTVGAHNVGVVLQWMLPRFEQIFRKAAT
jgi:hypothetical protein